MAINVINKLKDRIPNIKLLLVGDGDLKYKYKSRVKQLNLEKYVDFLGYRKDVNRLMMLSDIAISTSRQEGLPVNIMEAMATGLPLVVTNCRGNRDLVSNNENGYVIEYYNTTNFSDSIVKIFESDSLNCRLSKSSLHSIGKYSIQKINKDMRLIYSVYV